MEGPDMGEGCCPGFKPCVSKSSVSLVSNCSTDPPCYRKLSIAHLVRERCGWLLIFFVGLVLAAIVVEIFESTLKKNVQLSYFVPLLIGHGGNTGSQSNATVIR